MNLTEDQKKKRAYILNDMVKAHLKQHPYKTIEHAVCSVHDEIKNDPVKLRVLNAIAATK